MLEYIGYKILEEVFVDRRIKKGKIKKMKRKVFLGWSRILILSYRNVLVCRDKEYNGRLQ
jgi:hypothetical protein